MNESKGSKATASQPVSHKRSSLWWVKWAALGLVLVIIVLVLSAPGMLSGGWGKGKITDIINANLDGSVSIDKLSLSWFGSQEVGGFKLAGPSGQTVVSVADIRVDASLWSLMWGGRDLGEIRVVQPRVNIVADESGKTNLQKVIGGSEETKESSGEPMKLPATLKLTVTDAQIIAGKPGLEPVRFESLELSLDLSKLGGPMTFHLQAVTAQGELTGRIQADGSVSGIGADGTIDPAKLRVEATADVSDLPIDGIDTLAQMDGVLTAALGPTLNLQLTTTPDEQSRPTITLTAAAERLNVQFNAVIDNDQIVGSGRINHTLTPALASKLSEGNVQLAADVPVQVVLESFRAPVGGFDPSGVAMNVELLVADGRVSDPQSFGTLSWSQTYASLDTENLARSIALDANAQLIHESQPGRLAAQARIDNLFGDDGAVQLDRAVIDGHVSVADLPTGLLDRLGRGDGLIPLALGPTLAVDARANSQAGQPTSVTVNVRTQTLNVDGVQLMLSDTAITTHGAPTVSYRPPAPLLQRYLPDEPDSPRITNSPTVSVTLSQLNVPLTDGKPDTANVALDATAAVDQLDVAGAGHAGDVSIRNARMRVHTDTPGSIKANVSATIAPLSSGFLAAPADVTVTVDELNVPKEGASLASVKLHATAGVSQLQLAGDPRIAGTVMDNLSADVSFDGPGNRLRLKAAADTRLPNQANAGSMSIDADLADIVTEDKVDLMRATGNATVKLVNLPTAFVDALAGQDGLLIEALGEAVNVDLRYAAKSGGSRSVEFTADSALLKAGGALDVSDGQPIRATRPLEADWTLTPVAYAKLSGAAEPSTLVLMEPAVVHARLEKLVAPPMDQLKSSESGGFDPSKYSVSATLNAGALKLKHTQTGTVASTQNLSATIAGDSLNAISAAATGTFSYSDPAVPGPPATGKLDATAKLSDLFDDTGAPAPDHASIDAQVNVSEVPVAFVDAMQQLDGLAIAALGERMNLTLSTQTRQGAGPISVSLRSTHAQADVEGTIQDGRLTLTRPLTGQVEVTEQLGRKLLANVNPLFESAQTADQPVRLTIPAEGVSIPVKDFNLADVHIPQIRLELGQVNQQTGKYQLGVIKLTTGGVLGGLISFAQRFGAMQGESSEGMTLVFTPIIVKLEGGRVDYLRRSDMLLGNSFHLATWGYVQLDTTPTDGSDDSNVRISLGITPDTLDRMFRIEGVPEGDMFVIPVKGRTSKPQIDWGAAVADMGTLQAQYNLIGNSAAGALVRGVVQKILKTEEARNAPPPSLDPLPWALPPKPQQANQQPQQPQQQEPEEPKTVEEQLIEEGLRQIFKKR